MQKTMKSKISFVGTGLHSGKPVTMHIHPSDVNTGITFVRTDITDRNNVIPANYLAVNDTQLCTRICNDAGVEVSTVEHIMAALAGTGLNNAQIDIDGPEVPIMDGSSLVFVREILTAGLFDQHAPVRAIRILRDIEIRFDDVVARLSPADNLEIDFAIDFEDAIIGKQQKTLNMANGTFVRELSDCRTFGRKRDVDALRAMGLALGGSLDNAIVVEGDKILNPAGFRRADECVRHKMLDALGDLYLAGAPIMGRYTGNRAGHRATNELLRALLAQDDAWEWVTCDAKLEHDLPGSDLKTSDFPL